MSKNNDLQWFSTLLLKATFSPISVQTGLVRAIFAKSAFVAITIPPVLSDPMLTSNAWNNANKRTFTLGLFVHKHRLIYISTRGIDNFLFLALED